MANWDYGKNLSIHPLTTSKFSDKIAFFKCTKGHTWLSQISNYKGCPFCGSFEKLGIGNGNQT